MKKLMLVLVAVATMMSAWAADISFLGYETNNLFAYWDGEYNSTNENGEAAHDGAATRWLDLTGNGYDWALNAGNYSWSDRSMCFNGKGDAGVSAKKATADFNKIRTCEVVWKSVKGVSGILFHPAFGRVEGKSFYVYPDSAGRLLMCDLRGVMCTPGEATAVSATYGDDGSKSHLPSGLLSLIKNGVPVAIEVGTTGLNKGGNNPALGGRNYVNQYLTGGQLMAMRLYSRVLTEDERLKNSIIDQKRFIDPNYDAMKITEDGSIAFRVIVDPGKDAVLKINGAAITGDVYTNYFTRGGSFAMKIEPKPGYAFSKWQGDVAGVGDVFSPETTVTVSNICSISAFVHDDSAPNRYVHDGLVAMWDGEYNTIDADGRNAHDAAATVWKDLAGHGYDLSLSTAAWSWATNALVMPSSDYKALATRSDLTTSSYRSFEICFTETSRPKTSVVPFFCGANRILWYQAGAFGLGESAKWVMPLASASPMGLVKVYGVFNAGLATVSRCVVNGCACKVSSTVGRPSFSVSDMFSLGFSNNSYSFHGKIHSIRLYDHPLTDAELAQNDAVDEDRFRSGEPDCTLEIVATEGGAVNVDGAPTNVTAQVVTVKAGSPVTLKAVPAAGYVFSHWSGSTGMLNDRYVGAATVHVTADSALTCTVARLSKLGPEWYAAGGILAHWDGLINAGADKPHDDEAAVWKDLSGKGNDWTLRPSCCWWHGCSLRMPGVSYVGTPAKMTAADFAKTRTCELVIRGQSTVNGIIVHSQASVGHLSIFNSGSSLLPYKGFVVTNAVPVGVTNCFSFTYAANKSSTVTGLASAKMNGEEQTLVSSGLNYNDAAVSLGGRASGNAYPYNGQLYALRLYARELSANERALNYALDRIRFFGDDPEDVLPDGVRIASGGTALEFHLTAESFAKCAELSLDGTSAAVEVGGWLAGRTQHVLAATQAEGCKYAWIGEPQGCAYAAGGSQLTLTPDSAAHIRLDSFTPSASVLHVAPNQTVALDSLAAIESVHVGSCSNETKAAVFTVAGTVQLVGEGGGYAILESHGSKTRTAEIWLFAGGRMTLLADAEIRELHLPDEESTLDLNGHALVIRHRAHVGRKGWSGRVVDAVGCGTVTWCKGGMAIMIR